MECHTTSSSFDLRFICPDTMLPILTFLHSSIFFLLLETTMESCKMLLVAIFVVTLSSVVRTAPLNSSPNRVEILIRLGLSPKLTSGTKKVSNAIIFQCEFYSVGSERTLSILSSFLLNVETFFFQTLFLQMKSVYPFIASNTDLQNTMLLLGTVVTPTCSAKLVCNFSCHFVYTLG